MFQYPRSLWFRRIWRIVKRLSLAAFVLLIAFLIFGFFYEQSALNSIAKELPPPGKRVDVGGRMIHLHVQGEGRPTVIFESGLGASSIAWDRVAPEVAKYTRVITYDRAGLGWSDPGPVSDAGSVADDLHAALLAAEIEGPYVLVGHSIGGIYVRMFAYRNPSDVVGIVLVDSSHEDQFDRFPAVMAKRMRRMQFIASIAAQSAHCGIPRLISKFVGHRLYSGSSLPEQSQMAMMRFFPSYSTIRAVRYELAALPRNGKQLKAEAVPWDDLPLVVLTAGNVMPNLPPEVSPEAVRGLWTEFQQELASRSTSATHRVVSGSGHNIHQDRPAVVIEEILRWLKKINRTTTRLHSPSKKRHGIPLGEEADTPSY